MSEFDLITKWLFQINRLNVLIIVEGIKDKVALESVGVVCPILTLKKPLFQVVEDVAKNNTAVVILTDYDSEGDKLFKSLNLDFQRFGVNVHKKFRDFLSKNTQLTHIEGIAKYMKNL